MKKGAKYPVGTEVEINLGTPENPQWVIGRVDPPVEGVAAIDGKFIDNLLGRPVVSVTLFSREEKCFHTGFTALEGGSKIRPISQEQSSRAHQD